MGYSPPPAGDLPAEPVLRGECARSYCTGMAWGRSNDGMRPLDQSVQRDTPHPPLDRLKIFWTDRTFLDRPTPPKTYGECREGGRAGQTRSLRHGDRLPTGAGGDRSKAATRWSSSAGASPPTGWGRQDRNFARGERLPIIGAPPHRARGRLLHFPTTYDGAVAFWFARINYELCSATRRSCSEGFASFTPPNSKPAFAVWRRRVSR